MKHFLNLADLTPDEIRTLLDLAVSLKAEWKAGGNRPILKNKTLAMLFQKPSLRTRISFEMGMKHLGGHAIFVSPNEVQMGQRESVPDVARVVSSYVDGIMARVYDHKHILQLAEYASVPVINGLSDFNHPAQALTDLLTILEVHGRLEGLKMVYVGDGNNVSRSLLYSAAKMGMHFTCASPDGYTMTSQDYEEGMCMRVSDKQQIEFTTDPVAAVAGADIITNDVWTSMGQEAESAERLRVFHPTYQINKTLLNQAPDNCIVMHCLPAHRGEEITSEIADGAQSVLFHQAENRLHAQKAILATLLQGD